MKSMADVTAIEAGSIGVILTGLGVYFRNMLKSQKDREKQDWDQMLQLVETLRSMLEDERKHCTASIDKLEERIDHLERKCEEWANLLTQMHKK